jgi:hypothetical protein
MMVVVFAAAATSHLIYSRQRATALQKTPAWMEPMIKERQKWLSQIHVDDGIDATEASLIGDLYRSEYLSGCGAAEDPELDRGRWTIQTRMGITGKLRGSVITIDAKSGGVSSASGPDFSDFRSFSEDLVGGFPARRR